MSRIKRGNPVEGARGGGRSGGDSGFCWGYVAFEALPNRHKTGKQLDAEADSLKREIELCESSAFCGG